MDHELMTVAEAARRLGWTRQRTFRWIREGKLRATHRPRPPARSGTGQKLSQ